MPGAAALLFATTFTLLAATTLVLKSGQSIEIISPLRMENDRAVFRAVSGTLYSIPTSEIDHQATRMASAPTAVVVTPEERTRLRVSDEEKQRLLVELSRNRAGKPAPSPRMLEAPPPAASPTAAADDERREWSWRREAQTHEESIRQAKEDLDLLLEKADLLRSHIASLVSLGYKPRDFTYDTTMLVTTLEQIPYAELAVTRAERSYAQFREEARKRDILPGWLR